MKKRFCAIAMAVSLFASLQAEGTFLNVEMTITPEQIQDAIQARANVNAQDTNGQTPLILAAWNNPNPEVTVALLNAGAEVDFNDMNGRTPLMMAAWFNANPEIILALLKTGADATLKDNLSENRQLVPSNTLLKTILVPKTTLQPCLSKWD